jgi:oligoribonuclease
MEENAKKILWIDLEMTGLDPATDRIVEVAAIVTDWDFNELAAYETGVGQDATEVQRLLDQNEWYANRPENKAAMLDFAKGAPAETDVVRLLDEFLTTHFGDRTDIILAGNSIHQDRRFIRQWWTPIEERLHYRMLDVSAWKVVLQGKFDCQFEKTESHRALDDIRESIDELRYYLRYFGQD